MFGAQRGLGYLLMQAMSLHNMQSIMALTLLLLILAATVNAALLTFERRLHAQSDNGPPWARPSVSPSHQGLRCGAA